MKMLIVTDHKPICWKCGETSHFFSYCPDEKASGIQDQTPHLAVSVISVSPVMSMPETEIGVGKPPVGSRSPKILCPPLLRLWRRKRENGWLLVGSEGRARKLDLSPLKLPRPKVWISPTPSTSVKGNASDSQSIPFQELQKKYDPGYEKTEKIKLLKPPLELNKIKKKSPPKKSAGFPTSTPPIFCVFITKL